MSTDVPSTHFTGQRLRQSSGVLLSVLAMTLILTAGIGQAVTTIWPETVFGSGFYEDNLQRIRHGEDWARQQAGKSMPRLAVILGSCTMREAISVTAFNDTYRPDWNIMGLCGIDHVVPEIIRTSKKLEQSILRPDHIIIGLAPKDFLGSVAPIRDQATFSPQPTPRDGTQSTVAIRQFAGRMTQRWNELRTQVSLRAERVLESIHVTLMRSFPLINPQPLPELTRGKNVFQSQNHDPFREVIHFTKDMAGGPGKPAAVNRGNYSTPYTDTPDSERRFRQPFLSMIHRWLNRGVRVTVIFLPEHSLLRRNVSADLNQMCTEYLLDGTAGQSGFQLVTLRDELPDNAFGDVHHVGPQGRQLSVPLLEPWIIPKDLRQDATE